MEFHSVVNLHDHRTARGTENDMWSARHIQHFWFFLVQSELPSIGHQCSRLNIYSCHSAVQNTVNHWDLLATARYHLSNEDTIFLESFSFRHVRCIPWTFVFFHRHIDDTGVSGGLLGVKVRLIVNVRFLLILTAIVASHGFLHQLYNVTIGECECDYLPRRRWPSASEMTASLSKATHALMAAGTVEHSGD